MLLIQEQTAPIPKETAPTVIPLTLDDADNAEATPTATKASFGIAFPTNPDKGDLFLRVDYLPNRLFKWNGIKWIEVDKTTNDRYIYEEEYIKYLEQKIRSGEYSIDDLSKPEQEELLKRLDYQTKSNLK